MKELYVEHTIQMPKFAEQEIKEHLGGYHHALHDGSEENQGQWNTNHGIKETESLASL